MKILSVTLLTATFICLCSSLALAQKTQTIQEIDGKKFYIHVVEKGHTVYAISRLYGVPVDEINRLNPSTSDGLSLGETLRIPAPEEGDEASWTNPIRIDGKYLIHKAVKGETIFSIAQTYSVDVNDLMELNPSLTDGLKKGQELRIPLVNLETDSLSDLTPQGRDTMLTHRVEPGETIYSIGKKYNVTETDLRSANDNFPTGLKAGAEIYIPSASKTFEAITRPIDYTPANRDPKPVKDSYTIGVLLPFYTDLVDTSNVQSKEGKLQEVSLSIYRGVSLALDSLAKLGLNARVHVKDVSTTDKAGIAVNSEPLNKAQLIIGPLQRNLIDAIATQCAGNGTHLLCPVPQNNKVLLSRPAVSKLIGSETAQISALANHVRKHHSSGNIIVLSTGYTEDLKNYQLFTEILNGTNGKGEPVAFTEHKTNGRSVSGLSSLLSLSRENIIVALTSNEVLLADMVTKLSLLNADKYRIHLIGLESWTDFKFLDAEQRNRFDVHLPAFIYADLADPLTRAWYRKFRERFNTDPDDYALSAFDAMMFYGLGLLHFGSNFDSHFSGIVYKPRSIRFNMNKTGLESGFDNQSCFVLRYSNYLLVNADEQDE